MTDMVQAAELALVNNDLGALQPEARLAFLKKLCESMGLNPMTQPFQYIRLNGRLTLYATKGCADQLRKVHGISIEILQNEVQDGMIMVHARGTTPDGRTDEDIAVVPMRKGMDGVNDRMKAITKAKRRLTLSICGLGMLDESELATIPSRAIEQVAPTPEVRAVLEAPAKKEKPKKKPRTVAANKKAMVKVAASFAEAGITDAQLCDYLEIDSAEQFTEQMQKELREIFKQVSRGQYPKGLEPMVACSDNPPPPPGDEMAGAE